MPRFTIYLSTYFTKCSYPVGSFGSLEKPFILDINPEHLTYFDSINRGGVV